MTQTKPAKKTPRRHDVNQATEEEDFDRPDAATAEEGGPPHEHPAPSGADSRAPRNDAEHGYSQDSGYASSGGPSRGPAQKPERGA